ncbi:MAG: hypothetical protein IKR06_03250 [Erysipelotrichaceae bacterium]|nr:hypothetical protein [Erysipelotrichaceae bacterium]
MNMKELGQRFPEIVKKDTKLDERETMALLDLYIQMMDEAQLGLFTMAAQTSLKIAGAIQLLMDLGKIQDDEDLHMLMNEIESEAYKAIREA